MNTKKRKKTLGEILISGAREALEHAKGNISLREELRALPENPPRFSKGKVKKIRKSLSISQSSFARILGVTSSTVQSWEQGFKTPGPSSRRLLEMLEKSPEKVLDILLAS